MRPGRVTIVIDELRIAGFGAADGRRLGQEFRHELARLLETRGVPSTIRSAGSVDALPTAPLATPDHRPGPLGRSAAGAVYASLAGPGKDVP